MRFSLFAGVAGLIMSSSAFAGSPHPTAQDADGDGFYVPTVDVNGDSAKDAKDIGVKKVDCNDEYKQINPGATEVVADGIDQDCSGADLVLPISQPAWLLFVKNEYGGSAPSASRFVYEHDQCVATAGKCVVDKIDGRFKVTDEGVQLKDIYVNGGKVLRNNGQKADGREIVTTEEIQHYRGSSASSGGSGLGTKAVTKIAEDKAAAAVKIETDQRIAGQLANADDILAVSRENERIAGLLTIEEARAIETERLLREDAKKAQTDATRALEFAQKRGTLLEAYELAGTMISASEVTDGDEVARGMAGGGAGAGINFGVDFDSCRFNGFVDSILGADGGASLAHSEAIGIEMVGEKGLGGFAAYSVRSSQPNSLETQVLGRNPLAGVSFVRTFAEDGAKHGLFQVRAGLGPEFIGMSGDSVTDGVGLAGRLTVSVGGGIGALK